MIFGDNSARLYKLRRGARELATDTGRARQGRPTSARAPGRTNLRYGYVAAG